MATKKKTAKKAEPRKVIKTEMEPAYKKLSDLHVLKENLEGPAEQAETNADPVEQPAVELGMAMNIGEQAWKHGGSIRLAPNETT